MENKETANDIRKELNDVISKLSLEELVKLRKIINPIIDEWNTKYYSLDKHWDCSWGVENSFHISSEGKIKNEIYTDSENIKTVAEFIYNQYNNIIQDTTSFVDVVSNLSDHELDLEERYEISASNIFMSRMKLEQIILKEDLENIKELIKKNPYSYLELKNYIKNSKSNGLIRITDYYMKAGYDLQNDYKKHFESPFGIFDYRLLCNALKKLGLNIYLENLSKISYYKNSTYDCFLKCLLKDGCGLMIISDKRFALDKCGFSIYTSIKNDKQKKLKY